MKCFIYTLTALISFSVSAKTGTGTSNGGDQVRASYIKSGKTIIDVLKITTVGQQTVKNFSLDLAALEATLNINKIQVVTGPLIDVTGSVVDAIGAPGLVKLDEEKWSNFFNSGKDIYYLIFHEMLRSASYDDDNYRISEALNPFPSSGNFLALKNGIYHSSGTRNTTECSLRINYDPTSKTLTVQSVNQFNGNYACNDSVIKQFQCEDPQFGMAAGQCGIGCYHAGGGSGIICKTLIQFIDHKSFSITGDWDVTSLGGYQFAAEQSLPPKKFLGYLTNRWKFNRDYPGTCKIPPHDAALACDRIPQDVVQMTCKDLKEGAEQAALVRCQNYLNKDCKIVSTTTKIFVGRSASAPQPDYLETGCESASTAVEK